MLIRVRGVYSYIIYHCILSVACIHILRNQKIRWYQYIIFKVICHVVIVWEGAVVVTSCCIIALRSILSLVTPCLM